MAGGAPIGSKNAKKSRLLEQAFIREIKQRDIKDGDGETMRKLAAVYVNQALGGDISAAIFIRDTVDGKPAQAVQLSGDPDNPITVQERPQISKEEWLKTHGLGSAGGTAE